MVSNQHSSSMVKIYIEGGGDQASLHRDCRRAFTAFLKNLGFQGRMPRVIACGSRNNAYKDFCTALISAERSGEKIFLLVDSENEVQNDYQNRPWEHLWHRDHWNQPDAADDEQVHLMIQCMESWFLADPATLQQFFGQGFRKQSLPANPNIETIDKTDVIRGIEDASRNSRKGQYGKGRHSFEILEIIDAGKVIAASPSAMRFKNELDKVL